jgi:hypothetical protein
MSAETQVLLLGGHSVSTVTPQLRWLGSRTTTTSPPRLQQAWQVLRLDDKGIAVESVIEWRDVPLHLED